MTRSNRRLRLKRLLTVVFAVGFVVSFISTISAFAAANLFKIQNAELSELSTTAEGAITGFNETSIASSVTFHRLNDSAEYTITLKNTDDKDHIIESITDDNASPCITYTYDQHINEQINAGADLVFVVTAKYTTAITDINARAEVGNVTFAIKFQDVDEPDVVPVVPDTDDEGEDIVVPDTGVNPKTGDFIHFSIISLVISAAGLIIIGIITVKKHKKASKFIFATIVAVSAIATTATVKATTVEINSITFDTTYALKDKLVVTHEDADGNEHQEVINYGEQLTLDTPEKAGHTFTGWTDENGNAFDPTTPITDDIKITPNFSIDTYGITYDLNGGITETANVTNYTVNDTVTLAEPTKNHYNFIGWTGTGLESPTKNVVIPAGSTGARSYTANYEPVTYSITYQNIEPAELAALNIPDSYTIESASFTIGKPANRTDDDGDLTYTFAGWKDGETISDTITLPNLSAMGDKTLIAQWTPVDATIYTISYELNGGTTATTNRTSFTKEDETFTLVNPTKTGYTFKGWSGTDLDGDENVTVQVVHGTRKDLSFEAHYTANTYKVVFNRNGGEGNMSDQTLTYDQSANLTTNIYTRTGYSFNGWNTDAGGNGTAYVDGAEVENLKTEGEIMLYAQWTPNNYTIIFACNHANCEGTMDNLEMTYDATKTLPLNTFTVSGYSFTGWDTKATGDGDSYGNGAEVNSLAATGTITLYAKWATVDYDISYELNGGTANNPATYTTEQTITLNNPERTGYNFTGWSGTDLDGEDNMEVTIPAGSTGNRSYTAHWSDPISYNIEYTGLDALTEEELAAFTNPTTYTIESSFTLQNPAHLGYHFTGWTGSNGDTPQTTVNVAAGTTGSLSYHANFAANTYTVVFEKNPGTHNIGGDMDAQAFIYDTEQALTDNAFTIDEPGFKYGGWNTEADGSGMHYDDKQTVENLTAENEGTVTLYAEWGRTPYTIAFNKNNEAATGEMSPVENIEYGEHITLPQVGFVYNDHKIASWNTEPDGSGRSYGDQADVVNVAVDGTITLYAQWRDTEAIFLGGTRPKMKWIALAGGNQANITAIRQYAGTPDVTTFTDDNIVSEETSPDPIYTWYDNGTIYYWSEDNHPALSAFSREMFDGLTKAEVIEVKNLDTSNVTNMIYMFRNCSSLKSLDLSNFDTSNVTTMIGMFQNDSGLTEIDITGFNTENVKSISGMFMGCTRLTEIDLSHMNTQKITDMSNLFRGCTNLENVIFGEDFKAEEVTTMQNMFMGCTSLKVLDLSTFEATKVTNVYQMFLYDSQLETIYVTNPEAFSNMTLTQDMFHSCGSLVGGMGTVQSQNYRSGERAFIDLGPDRPGYFTDKTKLNIFFDANGGSGTMQNQTGLPANTDVTLNSNQFNTPGIGRIFGGWNTEPDGTGTHYDDGGTINAYGRVVLYAQWGKTPYTVIFDANGGVGTAIAPMSKEYGEHFDLPANTFSKEGYVFNGWNTMADGSGRHYGDQENVVNLDTDGVVTLYAEWIENQATFQTGQKVNDIMRVVTEGGGNDNYTVKSFARSQSLPDLDTINYRIASTNDSAYPIYIWGDNGAVYWYSEAETIYLNPNSQNFFYRLRSLASADVSEFNTSKVENMAAFFYTTNSLTSIDISNWDTSNVNTMEGMFRLHDSTSSLTNITFPTNFDTSKVTTMNRMFEGQDKLTSLDLHTWNTSNVEDMSYMFYSCKGLTSLTFGGSFDTSKVKDMEFMFYNAENLTTLDLHTFNTSKVTNMWGMFGHDQSGNRNKFETINIDGWDTSHVTNLSGMFIRSNRLVNIDLSNIDTSSATTIEGMFKQCDGFEVLDLSTWDTGNLTNIQAAFSSMANLKTIYVSDKFKTDKINTSTNVFEALGTHLVGGAGTNSAGKNNVMYARVDNPDNSMPGLFTLKDSRYIRYDANGGEGAMASHYVKVSTSSTDTLRSNTFTREGFEFVGWNTATDGSGDSYSDEQLMSGEESSKTPLTLYAQWAAN